MGLDEYQLLTPLGANELCQRYEARSRDGRLVEVRLMRDDISPIIHNAIGKRIRLTQMLDHLAIQHVLLADWEHQPAFAVFERVVNGSLADSATQSFVLADTMKLTALAEGLAASHRLGMCHGEIAPETIFLSANEIWTVDVTGTRPLKSESCPSTFTAPEVIESGTAEPASDVYSLAGVLEWLLQRIAPCDEIESVRSLCTDCRSLEPTARPTVAQFAARLKRLITPNQTVDEPPGCDAVQRANEATAVETTMALPSSEPPFTPVAPGHQLGRYEIIEKLGEGGMGAVYRARDTGDGTIVAIKVLNRAVAATQDARRRFAKEARLLARANNPYVANLLAFNDDAGFSYLTLEFVPGGSVGSWLKQNHRCREKTGLTLIADTARGLSVAHQRGIVHRDIKPDNILLTSTGATFLRDDSQDLPAAEVPLAKLSDFGLARGAQLSESLAITYDGMLIGTPLYMSPEQCRGAKTDARSDVYSLGVTLFHLLTGRAPFEGESPVDLMNKHCHEAPPPLRKLQPSVSEGVERVVAKCLAKNPDARYSDAFALLQDIENLRRGAPTSIGLHPAIPATSGKEVLTFEFSWDLDSTPEQLWPYVSNTDRVNNAMGLPAVRYRTQVDPQQGVRRFAETSVSGQRLTWEEHPYEWIEARRMSVLREFTRGPFHWFVNVVELRSRAGGGTTLSQTFKIAPVNRLGRWLAKFSIGMKSGRALQRVYQQIDRYVARGDVSAMSDAFRKPAELPGTRRARLQQRLDALLEQRIDPQVIQTLGQYLAYASDQEVARIRPLAFAERFRLDPSQVTTACLWGARHGLLVLLWDILCPSCRIPADVKETLAALQQHGYCEACNVDFQLDFANSVEVIFRAHPDIRRVETRTYCIGGPAFSAHVVAQTRLRSGERFEMELALPEGAYRVRGPQLPFAVDLRVTPAAAVGHWELALARPPPLGQVPPLQTRNQVITLLNDSPQELQVRLERAASKSNALTAAEASCLALFREMFPGEILSPGQMVSITSVTLLLIQVHQSAGLYRERGDGAAFDLVRRMLARVEQAVAAHSGAIVKIEGDGVLAVFSDTAAAVRAAAQAMVDEKQSPSIPLQLAIHRGPAMVTTLNDRLDYFGNSVHTARSLLSAAQADELLLSDSVTEIPEVIAYLRDRGFELRVETGVIVDSSDVVTRCRGKA